MVVRGCVCVWVCICVYVCACVCECRHTNTKFILSLTHTLMCTHLYSHPTRSFSHTQPYTHKHTHIPMHYAHRLPLFFKTCSRAEEDTRSGSADSRRVTAVSPMCMTYLAALKAQSLALCISAANISEGRLSCLSLLLCAFSVVSNSSISKVSSEYFAST